MKKTDGRLIAIGDIHGHAQELRELLAIIQPMSGDTVVTLGDYINRGPDGKGVLDSLIALQRQCTLVPILGNHDEMMLDARESRALEERFRHQGGSETLSSYGPGDRLVNVPSEHWSFLEQCLPVYEEGQFVFTHANYCWYSELLQQPPSLLRWLSINESPPKAHLNGKTFILGHTPGPVRDFGFCRCIDTGCGFGGPLTAMDANTGEVWQTATYRLPARP